MSKLRIPALLSLVALLSCDLNDSTESPASVRQTVAYAPTLRTETGAPLPVVDSVHVRLWVDDTAKAAPDIDSSIHWNTRSVKLLGLAVGKPYKAIIEGRKLGKDGQTLSTWWSTSTTGSVAATVKTVLAEDLRVVLRDSTLPVVVLRTPPPLDAATPQAALSFALPPDVAQLYIDDKPQPLPESGKPFTYNFQLGTGESRTFKVRLIDQNQNVWMGSVTYTRAQLPTADKTAPLVTLLSPAQDTSLPGGTSSFLVRLEAVDPSGVESVRIGGKNAVLSGTSEWSATVALQSDSNAIEIVATDTRGNSGNRLLKIFVPPLENDVRLVDLGVPSSYLTARSEEDTMWQLTVPNIDSVLTLHPVAGDREAGIWLDDKAVADSIVLELSPEGSSRELHLRVVSAKGDSARSYLVRILHLEPDPISITPIDGAIQSFEWRDSLPTFAWRVTGNRPLGTVKIGGMPVECADRVCGAVITLDVGSHSVGIEAGYADIPDRIWKGSIEAIRRERPASSEARLFSLGLEVTGGTARIDTSLLAAESLLVVEIENSAGAVTLRPRATSDAAKVRIFPGGDSVASHALSGAGGLLRDTIEITAEDGSTRSRIHVVLRHLAPARIDLIPRGGDAHEIAWDDSAHTVTWTVKGARRLGRVTIGDVEVTCQADTCSRRMDFPVARIPVVIQASYEDVPDVWSDTIHVTRHQKPLSNDVGILSFGPDLPAEPQGSDSVRVLRVPVGTRSLTLAPRPSGTGARAEIEGAASREITLSPDGDSEVVTVKVTSEDASRTVNYHLTILHPAVSEPAILAVDGDSVFYPFDTRTGVVTWTVAPGPWPLGPVYIDGLATSPVDGRYSRTINLTAVGTYRPAIRVSYLGGSREWRDTVFVKRNSDTLRPRVKLDSLTARVLDVPFDSTQATVGWRVSDNHRIVSVTIGNQNVPATGSDLYARRVNLAAQPAVNQFLIVARDSTGNETRDSVRITRRRDSIRPLIVPGLGAGMRAVPFDTTETTVSWSVSDNHRIASVAINGEVAAPQGSVYTHRLQLAAERTSAVIVARDSTGNESRDSIEIVRSRDTEGPALTPDAATFSRDVPFTSDRFSASWTVRDNDLLGSVKIGVPGDLQAASQAGAVFSREIPLIVGENRISIVATDRSNNTSQELVTIRRQADLGAPTFQKLVGPSSDKVDFDSASITVAWKVEDAHKLGEVRIGGEVIAGVSGVYTRRLPLVVGPNVVALLARDSSGNVAVDTVKVERLRDAQAPTLTLGGLPRAVEPTTSSIQITCQATDNHKIQRVSVSRGGSTVNATLAAGNYSNGTFKAAVPLALGNNDITVVAYDSTGNSSAVLTASVIRDNVAPWVISKTQFAGPEEWKVGKTVTVEWVLSDDHKLHNVSIDREHNLTPVSPGVYRADIAIQPGSNAIRMVAIDSVLNMLEDTIFFDAMLKDAEGNFYRIMAMPDTNVWMAQNLRSTPPAQPFAPVECQSGDCEANGRHYTWTQAMNLDPQYNRALAGGILLSPTQGICPDGWHVPTLVEWNTLFFAVAKEHGLSETQENGARLLKTVNDGWFTMALVAGVQEYTRYPGENKYQEFLKPNWDNGSYYGAIGGARFWTPVEYTATTAEVLEIVSDAMPTRSTKTTGQIGLRCVAD